MSFLAKVAHWFTTASHWRGPGGIPHRLEEHLFMCLVALLTAAAVAVPFGLFLGHGRRGGVLGVNLANIGRAIPSFAILVFAFQIFGIGLLPPYFTLVALAIPPMVTNAFVGVRGVDRDVVDAARGMGMSGLDLLRQVEAPLAAPLVMAGVRTAGVQVIATATLAAVVAWGGLGRYIVDGFAQRDNVQVFAGALLVATVALATEIALGRLQRAVTRSVRLDVTEERR